MDTQCLEWATHNVDKEYPNLHAKEDNEVL